ncbi:MAG: hypothetical protein AAB799_02065 [Patescibacteria group bacterium]
MPREPGLSFKTLLVILLVTTIAQTPSALMLVSMSKMFDAITRAKVEILATQEASEAEVSFVNRVKNDLELNKRVLILIGPYKRLYGEDFSYQLRKHLVFVEQSQTTEELFLILFDKTFHDRLNQESVNGILAHEMWHIFTMASGKVRPGQREEIDADDFAVRYVAPDVLIALYRTYEGDNSMREAKISNLLRQRQTAYDADGPSTLLRTGS